MNCVATSTRKSSTSDEDSTSEAVIGELSKTVGKAASHVKNLSKSRTSIKASPSNLWGNYKIKEQAHQIMNSPTTTENSVMKAKFFDTLGERQELNEIEAFGAANKSVSLNMFVKKVFGKPSASNVKTRIESPRKGNVQSLAPVGETTPATFTDVLPIQRPKSLLVTTNPNKTPVRKPSITTPLTISQFTFGQYKLLISDKKQPIKGINEYLKAHNRFIQGFDEFTDCWDECSKEHDRSVSLAFLQKMDSSKRFIRAALEVEYKQFLSHEHCEKTQKGLTDQVRYLQDELGRLIGVSALAVEQNKDLCDYKNDSKTEYDLIVMELAKSKLQIKLLREKLSKYKKNEVKDGNDVELFDDEDELYEWCKNGDFNKPKWNTSTISVVKEKPSHPSKHSASTDDEQRETKRTAPKKTASRPTSANLKRTASVSSCSRLTNLTNLLEACLKDVKKKQTEKVPEYTQQLYPYRVSDIKEEEVTDQILMRMIDDPNERAAFADTLLEKQVLLKTLLKGINNLQQETRAKVSITHPHPVINENDQPQMRYSERKGASVATAITVKKIRPASATHRYYDMFDAEEWGQHDVNGRPSSAPGTGSLAINAQRASIFRKK